MKRGKAVLALGVLAGAAALGLGGSMAAKRQPLPLPARYDLREVPGGQCLRRTFLLPGPPSDRRSRGDAVTPPVPKT